MEYSDYFAGTKFLTPYFYSREPMQPDAVIVLGRQAIQTTLLLSLPLLLLTLVVGLIISIFQAATQINESTLSFIPKLVILLAALVVLGPWMLSQLTGYTRDLFLSIPAMLQH
jgi:flagellar biosynthesis protein FliQ